MSRRAAAHTGTAPGDWDTALHAMDGHFLQSALWQEVQLALGYQVVWERGEGWMWSGAIRSGHFPRYLYLPHGPAMLPGREDHAMQSAVDVTRSLALDFVRLEPIQVHIEAALARAGAIATRTVQPRWTSILDISAPEATLRSRLSAGHRGNVNAAERRGLRMRSARDQAAVDVFLDLRERGRRGGGFRGQAARYHRTVAGILMPRQVETLYVAERAGEALAAAVCFDFADTRYYAHAVSDPEMGRRLGAATPLVWRMIMDARAAGLSRFDFWGVAPSHDPQHPWAGLTQFKMAFGGQLVARGGTWDVPVRRLRHRLYRAARRLRR